MKRASGAIACVVLWSACLMALAGWVRSHRADDQLSWRRLRPSADGALVERRVAMHSGAGGVRVAVRWGTLADLGEPANTQQHGPAGFACTLGSPGAYPPPDPASTGVARLGFSLESGERPRGFPGAFRVRWVAVTAPYWFAVLAAGAFPVLWLRRVRRRARDAYAGRCTACGYDLRATPDRCPECGATPERMPRPRLPMLPRAAAAAMMLVLPAALVPTLTFTAFFSPRPSAVTAFAPTAFASPTMWAPAKLGQPADFAPYAESIAGSNVTFTMVPIQGGTFRMGSPDHEPGRDPDEGPQVGVVVEPFYMGQFEVTWPEFDLFRNSYNTVGGSMVEVPAGADAVTYPTPIYELEAGPLLQRMGRGAGFPAVSMSHLTAKQYTRWLSRKTGRFYRLPTEAEWEYACRAGTTTAYHFGDDPSRLGDYAWYYDNASTTEPGDPLYHRVGSKKPNPWGLYDMHGNVAEWVLDGHAPDHYAGISATAAAGGPVAGALAVRWPARRYPRVIRGGGYESEGVDCRSAARFVATHQLNAADPQLPRSPYWEMTGFWIGFRVVCPVREPSEAEQKKYWDEDAPDILKVLDHIRHRQVREAVPSY